MGGDRRIKITIIGAGSREFTRGLIHDLVLDTDLQASGVLDVVLVDIDEKALEPMLQYALRCVDAFDLKGIRFSATTERKEALPASDFVLLSIAIKRIDLWEQDFRVPFSYGIRHIYGENGGPGALFHALRNFKILMPICRDIEMLCPDAYIFNFTNPEARILTLIRSTTDLKAYGLCHGFHSFRRTAAEILGRPQGELDIRTAGMNHFYTFYRISDKESGRDLIPEFSRHLNDDLERLEPLNRYLWENFGIVGYASDLHVGEYLSFAHEFTGCRWKFGVENRMVPSTADHVDPRTAFDAWHSHMKIEEYLRNGIMKNESHFTRDLVQPSGELAVPIITDIVLDRKSWRPAINTMNDDDYITNLPRSGCIEAPAVVDAGGVHPEHVGELPEGFAAIIRTQHAIQRLLVQAFVEGSKKLLLQALLLDPVVHSAYAAGEVLDTMLDLQKEYMPAFC